MFSSLVVHTDTSLDIYVYIHKSKQLIGSAYCINIGQVNSSVTYKFTEKSQIQNIILSNHKSAFQYTISMLLQKVGNFTIKDLKYIVFADKTQELSNSTLSKNSFDDSTIIKYNNLKLFAEKYVPNSIIHEIK